MDIAARAGVSRQTLYLHFGDRAGLLVELVQFMDETLGLEDLVARVFAAESSAEIIDRTMELYAVMAPQIDPVAAVLEASQHEDAAIGAAWRNRMDNRQRVHREIVQRIAEASELAEMWTIDSATELFYAITLPGPWRELTQELGWSDEDYRRHFTTFLQRALLDGPGSRDRP